MHDTTTNTKNAPWFLQGDDGTIYGPVDTATLKVWCHEGRIEPDNALSQDRETWVDAAEVEALEMDWIARLDDDTRYGPFNLEIVPGLIDNGIIPADAMLENRHTGERRSATPRYAADDLFPDWNPNPAPQAITPEVASAPPVAEAVDEDANQRLKDELAAVINAWQKAEEQLLEQQLRAAAAETEVETLKTQLGQIKELEQQLEHERRQARHPLPEPVAEARHGLLPALLLFLAGALLSTVSVAIILKGCTGPVEEAAPHQPVVAVGAVTAAAETEEREFLLETAGPLDLQPEAHPLPEAPAAPVEEGTALAIQWPDLSLPSARIQPSAQTLRIVFSEGLFSVSARLTPEAETALKSLAEQLHGKLNGHQLIIEGHTDATPIASAGSRYVDNFALGMARAEAVKTFLSQTGKLPASAMRTSSAGESAPPFSNETEADRKRNRTAVLALVAHPQ